MATAKAASTPPPEPAPVDPMATPLITGLATGAGGPFGQANAGTWSALDQYQAHLAANPLLAPVPPPVPPVTPPASATTTGS